MDMTFNCPACKQELAVDPSGAGSEIQCPACGAAIIIPQAPEAPEAPQEHANQGSISASAAAKIERHFAVPVHDQPAAALIQKARPPLEVAAKESEKKLRIKTIRHTDCIEVGRDRFDEMVGDMLAKIGESNIVAMHPITYTHLDIGSQKLLTDYGLLIVYRG